MPTKKVIIIMAILRKKENIQELKDILENNKQDESKGVKIINIDAVLEVLAKDLNTTIVDLDYRVASQFIQKLEQLEPISIYSAPKNRVDTNKAVEKALREENKVVLIEFL